MRNKIILLAMFICFKCGLQNLFAQDVKLINSTAQGWSGGIAGRSGTNYSFNVEFTDFNEIPIPDTVWIEGEPVVIGIYEAGKPPISNARQTIKNKSVRYEIYAGTYHDEYEEQRLRLNEFSNGAGNGRTKQLLIHPPIAYDGAALISYKTNGKEKYFVVKKIMQNLEPLAYP